MKEEIYVQKIIPRSPPSFLRRVSWGAIFAGLAASIVMQLMFTLLGVSIGASTIDPLKEQDPAKGLAMGSAIWLVASSVISLFIGAWIAGRLAGGPRKMDGLLHGVVTWSMATIVTVVLAASAVGALVGGAGSLMSSITGKAKESTTPDQRQQAMASVEDQLRAMFPQAGALMPTGRGDPGQGPGTLTDLAKSDPQLAAALSKMTIRGGANVATAERAEVVNLLTSKHNFEQQQANHLVNEWDQWFQQTKAQAEEKARVVGDKAAKGASQGALWGFIALALGGLVAAWGGWVGSGSQPRKVENETVTA